MCVCVCKPGIQVTVCMLMPTQGDDRGTSWRVQGAKKETINHLCHVQTRPASHGWVMGAMKVMRVTCAPIRNLKKVKR